jgi:hypothetical protein
VCHVGSRNFVEEMLELLELEAVEGGNAMTTGLGMAQRTDNCRLMEICRRAQTTCAWP